MERTKEVNHVDIWKRSVPSRRNNNFKGPKVEWRQVWSTNSMESRVAGGDGMRKRVVKRWG